MAICDCNVGLGNLGTPSCVPIASVAKRLIVLNYRDNDGNINEVDCGDAFDEAYFCDKATDADKSKRWFILPGEIKNIEDTKADSIFESFNDGSNLFIQEGTRTFTGMMPNQSPELLGQLKAARCVEIGVFVIDKNGNLIGNGSVDGKLRPIKVDQNTWNPVLMKGTDTTIQKISLTFEYSRLERDEDIRMITTDSFTYDLLTLEGVKDVVFTSMAAGGNTITFVAETIYGSQCNKVKVQGLGDPDIFEFVLTIDGVGDVITAVDETGGPGIYALTSTTTLTGGEVVKVIISKKGFEVISGNSVTA